MLWVPAGWEHSGCNLAELRIRARVRGGQPLEGLVPPQVARYIQINRLYRD